MLKIDVEIFVVCLDLLDFVVVASFFLSEAIIFQCALLSDFLEKLHVDMLKDATWTCELLIRVLLLWLLSSSKIVSKLEKLSHAIVKSNFTLCSMLT